MDTRRLRPRELLAAAGAVVLLVAMLLDWFSHPTAAPTGGPAGTAALNAWQAFGVIDVVLALLALAGIAVLALNAAHRVPAVPVAAEGLTLVAAILARLAVLYRLVDQPGGNAAVRVEPGLYLGLASVLAIFFGAYRALRDESPRATPAPAVELRPAPSGATPAKEGPA